jgi:hypothetical protein
MTKNFEQFLNEKKKEFDRVDYYKELTPSEFKVSKEKNIIKIEIKT